MSILPLVYTASASVGAILGLLHLGIWLRDRSQPAILLAAIMAFAAGTIAWFELPMAKAETVEVYAKVLSLSGYPICVVIISMVWFIRFRLGSGRLWLALLISGMWISGILLDVFSADWDVINSVTISTQTAPWGEDYTVGTASTPFLTAVLFNLPTPLMAFFAADAGIQSYRKGAKREACLFAGAVVFFILIAGVHSVLVDNGVVQTPYMISIAFTAIAMALAFGLIDDVARAAATTRNLELQRKRWIALLEGIHLAAIRRDQNGRITYVNNFLQKLIEKPGESILGKRVEDLAPQNLQQSRRGSSSERLAEKSRSTGAIVTADNKVRDFLWFNVPLENTAGEFDGMISLGEDVTENNKAHDELTRTQQKLERLSRILTIGELAATLAHELSQPIGAILSNIQAATKIREQQASEPDEIDDIIEDILRDTRRATAIMGHVRSIAFNTPSQFQRIELLETIRDVIDILSTQADANDVEIAFEHPEQPVFIEGSRIELQQVMMNLGLNSLQALMPIEETHKCIVFKVRAQNEFLEICVDDNGPGLLHQDKSEIFSSFSTTKPKGMGLGLAISRRIVERHRGTIEVAQSPLGGARFKVVLPLFNEANKQLQTGDTESTLTSAVSL